MERRLLRARRLALSGWRPIPRRKMPETFPTSISPTLSLSLALAGRYGAMDPVALHDSVFGRGDSVGEGSVSRWKVRGSRRESNSVSMGLEWGIHAFSRGSAGSVGLEWGLRDVLRASYQRSGVSGTVGAHIKVASSLCHARMPDSVLLLLDWLFVRRGGRWDEDAVCVLLRTLGMRIGEGGGVGFRERVLRDVVLLCIRGGIPMSPRLISSMILFAGGGERVVTRRAQGRRGEEEAKERIKLAKEIVSSSSPSSTSSSTPPPSSTVSSPTSSIQNNISVLSALVIAYARNGALEDAVSTLSTATTAALSSPSSTLSVPKPLLRAFEVTFHSFLLSSIDPHPVLSIMQGASIVPTQRMIGALLSQHLSIAGSSQLAPLLKDLKQALPHTTPIPSQILGRAAFTAARHGHWGEVEALLHAASQSSSTGSTPAPWVRRLALLTQEQKQGLGGKGMQ